MFSKSGSEIEKNCRKTYYNSITFKIITVPIGLYVIMHKPFTRSKLFWQNDGPFRMKMPKKTYLIDQGRNQ